MSDTFEAGQWKVQCDRCGFEYKARQLRLEWNNLRTCTGVGTNECWEPRQPQDLLKGKKDKQTPPWTRPEPEPHFLAVNEVTPEDL